MEPTTQKSRTTPKDFFLYLGSIATLYFVVVNFINLLFATIDTVFPRAIGMYAGTPDVSFPIASLIIAFPVHLVLMYFVMQGEVHEPAKRELPVRKWLGYFTLFVAGLVMVIDFIVLLNTFLRGEEITPGFISKVLVVFVVAGAIFGYYLMDLRSFGRRVLKQSFIYGSVIAVIAAIAWGFAVFGSPATQRALRYDETRAGDLQSLQWNIVSYWQAKDTVPDALASLSDPTRGVNVPVDPRTGEAYGYEKISTTAFKLCATFERASPKNGTTAYDMTKPVPAPASSLEARPFTGQDSWSHDAGNVCFDCTIDPAFYPKTTVTR